MTPAEATGAVARSSAAAPVRAPARAREGMRKRFVVKAAGIVSRGDTSARTPLCSLTFESWRALLHEGPDALHEVARAGQAVLELGLEGQLLLEVRVQHLVEGLLGARVRARG